MNNVKMKSSYGMQNSYHDLSVYAKILNQAKSVCAVVETDSNRVLVGSGLYIGNGQVLTCRHNFRGISVKEIERSRSVMFGDENNPKDFKIRRILFDGWRPERYDLSYTSDVAVVELKFNSTQKKFLDTIEKPRFSENVQLDDQIFSIGFRGGQDRLVPYIHDGGKVIYPTKVTFDQIEQVFDHATRKHLQSDCGELSKRTKLIVEDLEDRFYLAYGYKPELNKEEYIYKDVSTKNYNQKNPVFGFNLDGVGGCSGSPIFRKNTAQIIGIYLAGESDDFEGFSDFYHHELACGIRHIRSLLKKSRKKLTEEKIEIDI